jgi:hypothetical protein
MKTCRVDGCESQDISPGDVKVYNWLCRKHKAERTHARWLERRDDEEYIKHRAETKRKWHRTDHGRARKRKAAADYKAAKLQRTPSWNDELVMSMIYEDCPKGYHVDHVVPLQGDNVSGLHVHYNLQYLTQRENSIKGNKYD